MIDIDCYRVNYNKDGWEKITEGWTKANVVPGAILAVNALCDEVERLREALEAYAICSDGCTCGDGWSHDMAKEALDA